MHALLIYEEERKGQFVILPGFHGRLNILSADRYVIGIIHSADPLKDFSFELPCHKDGKQIGKCNFNISDLPDSKLAVQTFTFRGSPDESTITFSICWITPFDCVLESAPFALPPVFAIGHRGSGSNQIATKFLENSFDSFTAANALGADFVEFDIQMSKDGVPVIYHDLIGIVHDGPIPGLGKPHEITKDGHYRYVIQQFSEAEFRQTGLLTNFKTERTTFVDLLKKLPESLGFDIEIKYPARWKQNTTIPYANMNEMIDAVLNVMRPLAGKRQIVFSSFDPIVCAMLRLKQSMWPVLQLLCRKKRWTQKEMVDRSFALMPLHSKIGISGFVCDSANLLESPEVLRSLLQRGFVVNTYGTLNNTREGIEKQIAMGVRGFCTDDMELCRNVLDGYLKCL
jgi:glycerophosphodiester phosphodiesterase